MEAKEFRKGNYVQDVVSGEWMIIDEIGENIGAVIINRDKYPLPEGWQMGPILLIPEILEKAGFEKYEPMMYRLKYGWHWITVDTNSLYINNKQVVLFDYLHQLQNLYFALTGEELKIEL